MIKASEIRTFWLEYSLGAVFPPSQDEPLALFTNKMLELNEVLNLTKWTRPNEVLVHHLLDSAYGMPLLKALKPSKLDHWMDLGTGGGFPGALLLAACPEVSVSFLDAILKKGKALEQCLAAASWKGRVLTQRAENLGQDPQWRESFDGIVARAVADLPVLLEYAMPLLKPQGRLLSWLTAEQIQKVDKAQKALSLLQAQIVESHEYHLPGLSQARFILIVEKLGTTDRRYPRAVGVPSKKPLV